MPQMYYCGLWYASLIDAPGGDHSDLDTDVGAAAAMLVATAGRLRFQIYATPHGANRDN
jgi:hypothetical protein